MQLVGIINITPDSFSDGGKYNQLNLALQQTDKLIEDGANILDIGAESTRPNAKEISAQEEWARLQNILPQIIKKAQENNLKTSIDSRNSITAQRALDLGVDIINDVSGINDLKMINLLKSYNCKIIINHNLGIPANPNLIIDPKKDPINIIENWAINKINLLNLEHNIDKKNIIFDVGIGFGKNAQQSLTILENLKKLAKLNVKIYVGHSRKSFLNLYQPKNNLAKDLLTAHFAHQISPYTDYVRIHNVALVKEFLIMHKKIKL
jgi:dihydropteroate synthase